LIFWQVLSECTEQTRLFFSYPFNYPLVSRQRLSPSGSMDCKAQMSFKAENTKQKQNISGSALKTLGVADASQVTQYLPQGC